MDRIEPPVGSIVRGVVNHRDGDALCVVRLDSGLGMGNLWMPVAEADWPAGYWPPAPGDVVTMRMPVILSLQRPTFADS